MATLGTLLSSVRRLHCSASARAGSRWRLQQGLAASVSGYGPLTDLPDWSFAETSRSAVTGNGCWVTGLAAQAAGEVAGGRKETEKCSQTQRDLAAEPTPKSIKSNCCSPSPASLAFFSIT
ncbi:39S ribosomal protein L52, mitochondrial isoform X4 [Heterocephalus glaber]|uniref:Large ribosomal subunit protein mL52 n=1 Tax=Heterocephalus glaber TaxID=10181 RepID=A0AAX6RUS9_HETGA|nr:39S ribosomal protein L52, mitochondrial isoform X4 [Heterocephalus glaber]